MTALRRAESEGLGAIQFAAALEAYACGCYDAEALAHSARLVIDTTIPLDPDDARAIAELTGAIVKLATYGRACRAALVRRHGGTGRQVLTSTRRKPSPPERTGERTGSRSPGQPRTHW